MMIEWWTRSYSIIIIVSWMMEYWRWWENSWIEWIDNERYGLMIIGLVDQIFLVYVKWKDMDGICAILEKWELKVMKMIVFELDIPSLNLEGIEMRGYFGEVKELICSSMIDWLIMIEIVILNHLSYSIVIFLLLKICCLCIHQYCGYQQSMNWKRFVVVLSVLWLKEELERMKRHSIYQIFLP